MLRRKICPPDRLYVMRSNHLGWIHHPPGALLSALLIRAFGIRQRQVVLDQVSTCEAVSKCLSQRVEWALSR
jgi:hypothetical protein